MTEKNESKKQHLAADFAAKYIAPRPDLRTGSEFPTEIWQKMGEAGLLKIGIAEIFGGDGGGYLDLLKSGEAFVKQGKYPGLALSWLYQQILARFAIGFFGTTAQLRRYLPSAAAGRLTLSFAVSEPGHGSRPKLLSTRADKQDKIYTLTGEKTYLTNGPIADVFIVIAVTEGTSPQKRFTAFIVPRKTPGVIVTPLPSMNFLKPSPHGGIRLNECRLPSDALLGKEGTAWTDMVVPLGEIEDIVMMGPALGGMTAQLAALTASLGNSPFREDSTLQEEIGALAALTQAMRVIACEAADRLDRGQPPPVALAIAFARMAVEFLSGTQSIREARNLAVSDEDAGLQRDLEALVHIKKRLLQIRQKKIGAQLLKP